MIDTILMVSTSSIIVQSLGEIELGAPAVGAKIWCLDVFRFCLFVMLFLTTYPAAKKQMY